MLQVDFAAVQWSRKMTTLAQHFDNLSPADLRKFSHFLAKLAGLRQSGGELSEQQLQVIMQSLHSKELVKLEMGKGGVLVEFTGGGLAYERFLIRADGKVPNNRYESKKAD
jgi:hypothetical protein